MCCSDLLNPPSKVAFVVVCIALHSLAQFDWTSSFERAVVVVPGAAKRRQKGGPNFGLSSVAAPRIAVLNLMRVPCPNLIGSPTRCAARDAGSSRYSQRRGGGQHLTEKPEGGQPSELIHRSVSEPPRAKPSQVRRALATCGMIASYHGIALRFGRIWLRLTDIGECFAGLA